MVIYQQQCQSVSNLAAVSPCLINSGQYVFNLAAVSPCLTWQLFGPADEVAQLLVEEIGQRRDGAVLHVRYGPVQRHARHRLLVLHQVAQQRVLCGTTQHVECYWTGGKHNTEVARQLVLLLVHRWLRWTQAEQRIWMLFGNYERWMLRFRMSQPNECYDSGYFESPPARTLSSAVSNALVIRCNMFWLTFWSFWSRRISLAGRHSTRKKWRLRKKTQSERCKRSIRL